MTSSNLHSPVDSSYPPILGVALDMDGLLFDTERLYWEVGDTILKRRGYRYSEELQSRMMGRVGVSSVEQMIHMHGLSDSPEDLLRESDELYGEMLSNGLQPMPGLDQWISCLQTTGLPFGLATSSRRKFVDMILPTTDWHTSLSFILTGDDVSNGKPHPEMYLKAAETMQIPPASMLVLEDSGNGCAAAVAAGAQTVAVPSEYTQGQDFVGAILIANSLSDPRLHSLVG